MPNSFLIGRRLFHDRKEQRTADLTNARGSEAAGEAVFRRERN